MKDTTEQHAQLKKEENDVKMKYDEPKVVMIDIVAAIEILKKRFSGGKNEKVFPRSVR